LGVECPHARRFFSLPELRTGESPRRRALSGARLGVTSIRFWAKCPKCGCKYLNYKELFSGHGVFGQNAQKSPFSTVERRGGDDPEGGPRVGPEQAVGVGFIHGIRIGIETDGAPSASKHLVNW
jgi:hypothetical protein